MAVITAGAITTHVAAMATCTTETAPALVSTFAKLRIGFSKNLDGGPISAPHFYEGYHARAGQTRMPVVPCFKKEWNHTRQTSLCEHGKQTLVSLLADRSCNAMSKSFGNGDVRESPDKKVEKIKTGGEEGRDTTGGTYDVEPATAEDEDLPNGMTRERKGPLGPKQGRRQ